MHWCPLAKAERWAYGLALSVRARRAERRVLLVGVLECVDLHAWAKPSHPALPLSLWAERSRAARLWQLTGWAAPEARAPPWRRAAGEGRQAQGSPAPTPRSPRRWRGASRCARDTLACARRGLKAMRRSRRQAAARIGFKCTGHYAGRMHERACAQLEGAVHLAATHPAARGPHQGRPCPSRVVPA